MADAAQPINAASGDDIILSIGRIERALSRVEAAVATREGFGDGDRTGLKAEIGAILGSLDDLLARQ